MDFTFFPSVPILAQTVPDYKTECDNVLRQARTREPGFELNKRSEAKVRESSKAKSA